MKYNEATPDSQADGSLFSFTETKTDEATKKTTTGKTFRSRPDGPTKNIRISTNPYGKVR